MYDIELAKALKSRNNISKIGAIVGKVVGINPLKISILGGDVLLTGDSLHVCREATEYTMEVTTTDGAGTAKHEGLKLNDRAALIATEDNQKFFVIDKLV
ncbi:MAG: DUF2577 family protein [Desulfitobacterium sp.]